MCANSLYRSGPKTLLTDQHLLRGNLFFVTETSELRLAGLHMIVDVTELHSLQNEKRKMRTADGWEWNA